jgi:hypothetical protein
VVILYRRFGTTYRPQIQGSISPIYFFTMYVGYHRGPLNVGKGLQLDAALHPRRAQMSFRRFCAIPLRPFLILSSTHMYIREAVSFLRGLVLTILFTFLPHSLQFLLLNFIKFFYS